MSLQQHLFKHITRLEEENKRLQHSLESYRQSIQYVCMKLGYEQWQMFLSDVRTGKVGKGLPPFKTPSKAHTFKSPFESPIEHQSQIPSIRGSHTPREEELCIVPSSFKKITKENNAEAKKEVVHYDIEQAKEFQSQNKNGTFDEQQMTVKKNIQDNTNLIIKEILNSFESREEEDRSKEETCILAVQNTRLRRRVQQLLQLIESNHG